MERCVERSGDESACSDRWESKAEWYLFREQLSLDDHDEWVLGMAGIAGGLLLLAGATFIGADFNSGSLSNQLLFRPRRRDVWLAKSVMLGAVGASYAVLTIGVANAIIWAFAKHWDSPLGPRTEHYLVMANVRAIMIVTVLGLAGFAVGLITRHTAAALGLVAFYGIAAETVARLVWPGSEHWLLSNHVRAFIAGDWRLEDYTRCESVGPDAPCMPEILRFSTEYAAGYLGAIVAVVVLASLLVFRRRDVA